MDLYNEYYRTGYDNEGWDRVFPFEMPDEDITVSVVWKVHIITLVFNGMGATSLDVTKMDIPFDSEYQLPKPQKTGFSFKGWYLDSSELKDGVWNKVNYSQTKEYTVVTRWDYEDEDGYYEIGKYPQCHVSDTTLIETLNELIETNENGYYEYDGCEYAKMEAKPIASGIYYSDGSEVVNEIAWFKVEPILWNICTGPNNYYYLTPLYLLDTCVFSTDEFPTYSNSYLRYYLNYVFYAKAFNSKEKEIMSQYPNVLTEYFVERVDEGYKTYYKSFEIKDRVTEMSVLNSPIEYKRAEVTDYVLAQECSMCVSVNNTTHETKYYGFYWFMDLIRYDNIKSYPAFYNSSKNEIDYRRQDSLGICICPYICIYLE